jgi:hypothetical protein
VNVCSTELAPKAKIDKDEEHAITTILERLHVSGIRAIDESNARYALRAHRGHYDNALSTLLLLQETYDGLVRPFDPHKQLVGAVNREAVTCYLDALLFAMFMRLDSFEAILYDTLEDPNKKRLAGMLRLWVNMLRAGKLIPTDVVKELQEALAGCGWTQAAKLKQQDPSEAFTFITDQLQLPLLTLKMDLYHTGKDDPTDDHKFVNERLLEVAVLEKPQEGKSVITLEDCLEQYFNNRIEVMRFLERQNTVKAGETIDSKSASVLEKEAGLHIEVLEVAGTPLLQSPISDETMVFPKVSNPILSKLRPGAGRKRQDSIFAQKRTELIGVDPSASDTPAAHAGSGTKSAKRTEVLMPAWQFFKLLPWYTENMPTSDAQVAAHFASKRPVLGICLKRYSYTASGQAVKLDTFIDIPLEIQVPNFLSDEQLQDDVDPESTPVGGNFRLLLQSVVCHRGNSVHSGHYVALCRGTTTPEQRQRHQQRHSRSGSTSSTDDYEEPADPWVRFDDLAKERVTFIDIQEALKKETPYLLFYQVQPVGEDGKEIHDLPSYAEATSRTQSDVGLPAELEKSDWDELASRPSTELNEDGSSQAGTAKRSSIVFLDDVEPKAGSSLDTKQGSSNSFLALASRIGRSSRSNGTSGTSAGQRPGSSGSTDEKESRFGFNVARLTQKISRSPDKDVIGPVKLPPTPSQSSIPTTHLDGADQHADPKRASSHVEVITDSSIIDGVAEHSLARAHTTDVSSPQRKTLSAPEITALPSVDRSLTTSHPTAQDKRAAKALKRKKSGQPQDDRDCTVM